MVAGTNEKHNVWGAVRRLPRCRGRAVQATDRSCSRVPRRRPRRPHKGGRPRTRPSRTTGREAPEDAILDEHIGLQPDDGLLARPSSDERRASALVWLLATHDMRPAVLACERAESDRAELDAKTKKLAEVEERYRRVSEKLR